MSYAESKTADASDTMDYESVRAENIKRNTEFLNSIGIDSVKEIIADSHNRKKTTHKGAEKRKRTPVAPARRSGRITIDRLKNEIEEAKQSGNAADIEAKQAMLSQMVADKAQASYEAVITAESEVKDRFNDEPITMDTILNEPKDGANGNVLTVSMKDITVSECTMSTNVNKWHMEDNEEYRLAMSCLQIKEEDVAKVTTARITAVAVHPSMSRTIVCAGDKLGYVGIWDAGDAVEGVVDASTGGNEGVYLYQPHVSSICGLHCSSQEPSRIWSCSYDGTIRVTDMQSSSFMHVYSSPGDLYDVSFTDASFVEGASGVNSIFTSCHDGSVGVIDPRAGTCGWSYEVHDGKVTSIQCHPVDEHMIVTAGRAGYIAIHDIRRAGKKWTPLNTLTGHTKSVNAAHVSPDGQHMVSVCQDDTIKLWHDFMTPKKGNCHTLRHNNHTGRWLSTFKPCFDPKVPSALVMGSMDKNPRRVEVFTVSYSGTSSNGKSPKKNKSNSPMGYQLDPPLNMMSENLNSICSRHAFHPNRNVLASGNSSGRVHIFR